MSRATWPVRLSAVVASTALLLTGCGDDGDGGEAEETTAASPTPSTTIEVPDGVELTAPGTQLAFGEAATVAHEVADLSAVLELTVDSAVQGSIKDLAGFDLDDPYKRRGSYYYVRASVTNAGEKPVSGDVPVPLWGISGENTLLRAVTFTTSFTKCPTENLPKRFAPGDTFKTCLVYLSPDHGSLEGLSYRPTEAYDAIEWRGKVKPLPEPKKKTKKSTKGRDQE